ncbi:MAG: response regulator [Pedobacter sp.]|nr:response regulator [Chitinophagaceae bacterium]
MHTKDHQPYNILIIEDNIGDFAIVEDFLTDTIETPKIVHASNYKQLSAIFSNRDTSFDVVLLDLTLPDKNGQGLVVEILQLVSPCPVIILTGFSNIDFSIKSIAQGVSDYLIKDDLSATMLYKSIVYAIERKKFISQLGESEKQYSDLFQLSPQPMCLYEPATFKVLKVNNAAIKDYGYTEDEFLAMTLLDLVNKDTVPIASEQIKKQHREVNKTYEGKFGILKKSGQIAQIESFSTPLVINGRQLTLVIAIDVTEKNLYEHRITKAIIKTQENERYEIGAELHDNVCQILATSKISLKMLKKSLSAPGVEWYNQCNEYIGLASDEIRNLSHRLAPAFFNDTTLQSAFKTLLTTFNADSIYQIHLHFDNGVEVHFTDYEFRLNLYRILQEQLRNISKHAKATTIAVDLIMRNQQLEMIISDNGVGFDVVSSKNGIGITNMKRRTELFSGKFKIDSSLGNGSKIIIEIPFKSTK